MKFNLSWLRDLMAHEGIVEPFFTSDGASVLTNNDRSKVGVNTFS